MARPPAFAEDFMGTIVNCQWQGDPKLFIFYMDVAPGGAGQDVSNAALDLSWFPSIAGVTNLQAFLSGSIGALVKSPSAGGPVINTSTGAITQAMGNFYRYWRYPEIEVEDNPGFIGYKGMMIFNITKIKQFLGANTPFFDVLVTPDVSGVAAPAFSWSVLAFPFTKITGVSRSDSGYGVGAEGPFELWGSANNQNGDQSTSPNTFTARFELADDISVTYI